MSERHCRVADGTGWYTEHKDEEIVAKQLADRLKTVGQEKIAKLEFYYLGPKEPIAEEKRNRIVQRAVELLNLGLI